MKMTMDERYRTLLAKFYSNDELMELLDLLVLESSRRKMVSVANTGTYPPHVDLIDMLKIDLLTVEKFYDKK